MKNNKILVSFVKKENYDNFIKELNKSQKIYKKRIFVLNSPDTDEIILTYNLEEFINTIPNTITIHRKTEHNILYTIDALNLIKQENVNQNEPNWIEYKNSILTTDKNKNLRIIHTTLEKILSL